MHELSINSQVIQTLEYIRDNPNCRSTDSGLNPEILVDLYSKGIIRAVVSKPVRNSSPDFLDMNLTLDGQRELDSSNSANESLKNVVPRWYSNPFLLAMLSLVVMVGAAGTVYMFGW